MSAGEARSSGATCTITSYCSPSRLKRVTWRPPSIVSSVRPTVSTLTPMSPSLSRLMLTRTSGVLRRRSVCRFCTPGNLRASSRKRSTSRCSSAYGICAMITYSIGVERKLWPSDGGLIGNACAPGIDCELGPQLVGDLLLLLGALFPGLQAQHRVAVHHRGKARRSPCTRRPREPGCRTPRSAAAARTCTGGVEPCGAVRAPKTTPRSSIGDSSDLSVVNSARAHAERHHPARRPPPSAHAARPTAGRGSRRVNASNPASILL